MAKKKKFNYFKAYEKLSKLAVKESELLIDAMRNFKSADEYAETMVGMHEYENEGDSINHDIFSSAANDFMPPFDREDIVAVAQALDNVLDYIDDVLGHMYVYDIRSMPEYALEFADLIRNSCIALEKCMEQFHSFKKNSKFKQLLIDINSFEEQGDELYKRAMRYLHTKDNEHFMHVLVWSRIYERMEKCCDAIEHAADLVNTVLLKNV